MKLISYLEQFKERLGIYHDGIVYDLRQSASEINIELPSTMRNFLRGEDSFMNEAKKVNEQIIAGKIISKVDQKGIKLIAPIPRPTSCRDGYAFRQHVLTARRNRGVAMIPEFDQFPVFYFTNHNAIFGEGEIIVENDHLERLDFELEAAIVIGKKGKNIPASEADNYIAGYMIMNDLSARKLQMEEMKLSLGPAKGKDFATIIGPWLVTPDELEKFKSETSDGNKYDLSMYAYHNGKKVSEGNLKDMNWTFAQIIERASYGVELLPGDVIGSGTVGTGCYLELNGTAANKAKEKGENFTPTWLQAGDTIELEINCLGKLSNTIKRSQNTYSILSKENN